MPDLAPVPATTELLWAIDRVRAVAHAHWRRIRRWNKWGLLSKDEVAIGDLADDLDELAAQARRVLGPEGA